MKMHSSQLSSVCMCVIARASFVRHLLAGLWHIHLHADLGDFHRRGDDDLA